MLNVIIVDDEVGIISLIKSLIDYTRFSIEVIGTAGNGEEALKLIREKHPNVVITDIKMSGMNGIELIKQAKNIDSEISFLIISGYQEFEYAQQAVKLGAVDYLIKPINGADLNYNLSEIYERQKQRGIEQLQINEIKNKLTQNEKLLRQNALKDIAKYKNVERFQKLEEDGLYDNQTGAMCIASIYFDNARGDTVHYSNDVMAILLQKTVSYLGKECIDIEETIYNNHGICYLKFSDSSYFIHSVMNKIDQVLRNDQYKYDFLSITICFGKLVDSTSELYESFKSAELTSRHRIDRGIGKALYYDDIEFISSTMDVDASLKDDFCNLRQLLQEGNTNNIEIAIRTIYSRFIFSGKRAYYLYYLTEKLLDFIWRAFEETGTNDHIPDNKQYKEEVNLASSFYIMQNICIKYAMEVTNAVLQEKEKKNTIPIRKALQYIDQHFFEQISLDEIAKYVLLNPAYLSTIFKTETGMTITSYITKVRVDYAKNLLKEGQFSISDIAIKSGYQDARYFSRIFKENIGVTPKEYQKFYSDK